MHDIIKRFFILFLFFSTYLSFGEGTKELMPQISSDTRILIARGTVGGQPRDPFAVYNENPEYRLYIHISDPSSEKIYFGLGQRPSRHGLPGTGATGAAHGCVAHQPDVRRIRRRRTFYVPRSVEIARFYDRHHRRWRKLRPSNRHSLKLRI